MERHEDAPAPNGHGPTRNVRMTGEFWADKMPAALDALVDPDRYENLMEVLEAALERYADLPAFTSDGITITYRELDEYSSDFASYLQHETNIREGDRIALQMPNLVQYPVCIFGALKAGLVIVNTNPLYTEREMEHQFNDAQVRGLVVLENICDKVERVLPQTNIETVIITRLYDMAGAMRRVFRNTAMRSKVSVADYNIPLSVPFTKVLSQGRRSPPIITKPLRDAVAVLQYTGGTTGLAKGAMLTQRNLVANMLQVRAVMEEVVEEGRETLIAPLPLYHIYSFTLCCMAMVHIGAHVVLISHPRDLDAFCDEMEAHPYTLFAGLNTLFRALIDYPRLGELDFSQLKLTFSGAMALQPEVAASWEKQTGCAICEGYGLTEASPVVSVNPPRAIQAGTVGLPLPRTELRITDADGQALPLGGEEAGELWLRGPQVMAGYWQQEAETADAVDAEGWLRTGDIALIQPDGYVRIVDRVKDMIIVSGFNVYPNEIEEIVDLHPDVIESAAVGVPDARSGEALKVFVVARKPELSLKDLEDHCRKHLTGYKVPRQFELRDALPKSDIGKVLRRLLRDGAA